LVFSQESQNFVCYPNWKGIYSDIGTPASALQAPLNYHVVLTTEPDEDGDVQTFVNKVPETWMDVNLAYFLYPSPGFNVNGVKPWNWGDISFKKRRFPESSYVEYDVVDLLTETGSGNSFFKIFFVLFFSFFLSSVPFFDTIRQMEGAQVQVEQDEISNSRRRLSTTLEDVISNSRRLSKKRPSSEEKNYENHPDISQLVNLSGDEESEWEGKAESHPKAGSSKVAKQIYGTAEKGKKSVPDSPNSTPEEDYDHQLSPIKLSMKEASATGTSNIPTLYF
jgi:hypothetical protein